MPYFPSSEQVAVAWLLSLNGVPEGKVATTLPDAAAWADTGFVQVQTVGGSPAVDVPLYRPTVQVDCWATNPGSSRPAWGKAAHLANAVQWGTYRQPASGVLVLRDGAYGARVLTAVTLTEPRRITGDDAGFARVQVDVALTWCLDGVAA